MEYQTNNILTTNDKNAYVGFDPISINELIIKRLNQSEIFTDQNFQGSNLSSLLDIISYTFSTLLYYLNKTSSESMFSESQIYENMNRIVKLLNYNPRGKMTQTVGYNLIADLQFENNYFLPRYSYIRIGNVYYSSSKDIYFSYFNSETQVQNSDTDLFLFQGKFNEFPLYSALGASNEVLFLNLGQDIYLDHNNIHVYIKEKGSLKWEQWERTENLFLNKSQDKVFEVRFNPNKNYEIKFGDDINGKKLNTETQVLIYYLQMDIFASPIAANSLKDAEIILFNSINYQNILNDTQIYPANKITSVDVNLLEINNAFPSTTYKEEETVEEIRSNAPKTFSYQQRLVTTNDFQIYIIKNYSNIFSDCYVVNNEDYLNSHMKYLYDIGIKSPQLDNSILYNQIKFSNSCNFNNIYVYMVPLNGDQQYLTAAQKEIVLNDLQDQKTITCDIIPMDPVYMLFDFYVENPKTSPTVNDLEENHLIVYKNNNSKKSDIGIINDIINIFQKYFNPSNLKLGQSIDLNKISSDIINLNSVEKIQTYRKDINLYVDGLSMLIWNKTYSELDVKVYNSNLKLNYFQFPAFNNINNLINKIKIVNSGGSISITDY